ncbi:hypothetical protein [Mycolicibacter engbaekii]|uniref:hypothetical protein n=1 Tax=Mycolicibacter engbaekii TaxID=188915 RepID=UPI001054E8B9|nr:hypothetical protein [Mycolicibacter engbaekii]
MKFGIASATAAAGATAIWLAAAALAAPVGAEQGHSPPGCGFTSQLPWSPCAAVPPWGHRYPGGYDWSGKEPGKWGPGGYHYCDYREGCP